MLSKFAPVIVAFLMIGGMGAHAAAQTPTTGKSTSTQAADSNSSRAYPSEPAAGSAQKADRSGASAASGVNPADAQGQKAKSPGAAQAPTQDVAAGPAGQTSESAGQASAGSAQSSGRAEADGPTPSPTADAVPTHTAPQAAAAQTTQPPPAKRPSLEREFFKNLLKDQRAIWTSPLHLHVGDAVWLAPLAGVTTALILTDNRSAEDGGEFNNNGTHARVSQDVSKLGAGYADAGVAGAFYLVGLATGNARARETGLLAGEAMIDSAIIVGALKGITRRPRPSTTNSDGDFFKGGNSFPSGHAITAWTLATVVAEEYRKHKWVAITAYGLAALVSTARFTGHDHYLSDVLIGSAIGFGVGRYVYHAHHDPALDGSSADKKTITASKFFPSISPRCAPAAHAYGLSLHWGL